MNYLAAQELLDGAASQEGEWGWDNGTVANSDTPPSLSGESAKTGRLDHLDWRWPVDSMLPRPDRPHTAPRRGVT